MSSVLILGAGYVGAVLAEIALEEGAEVCLADNWYAVQRSQLEGLESALGAAVAEYRADITRRDGVSDMPAWTMGVASARDPVVAIVDYVCAVASRRLSAGPDTLDARQFRRFYPNKVRVLHDWQAARVYSRRHPFPDTWPTTSPASASGK